MFRFQKIIQSPAGSKFILQGNMAFAAGIIHAGYHGANGYPGTPSTEVIDKSLKYTGDRIQVGWSVNEAVAMGTSVGQSIAGFDTVVTMKIPGVFQAGDIITTSAFYTANAGALVIYAATDYVPSSTQHVIDPRYFFASSRIPVLEPRDHQEMYDIAWHAADISRNFHTPVVVLASGILAHSEGLVIIREERKVIPRKLPGDLHEWMLLPSIARVNYNKATSERIPGISQWIENTNLIRIETGDEDWGVIVSGESYIILKEALHRINKKPPVLSLSVTYPLPENRIRQFASGIKGKIFVIEDGDTFLEEKIRLSGIEIIGKGKNTVITDWNPEMILDHLSEYVDTGYRKKNRQIAVKPLPRPPSICPGCPYRAFALCVDTLKKKKKIVAAFGDIGCSTLLYFLNALDTVGCMGSCDSMRQGFVLSRPDMAGKTISVIGDSCECHSGMDSTRNAVFRNIPGVKVILNNFTTAMTGGQPAPSSPLNLEKQSHHFNFNDAVRAEGGRTVIMNAYNLKEVDSSLTEALTLAEQGTFSTIIIEGPCIQEVEKKKKKRTIRIDESLCKKCGRCGICPGIEHDKDNKPHFTNLCTACGGNTPICLQRCPFHAIVYDTEKVSTSQTIQTKVDLKEIPVITIPKNTLPDSLRVAIRGIGGQGNLFFGKVLSEVALLTPYSDMHIVKGDTHGMAQLGGPVISTFCCGEVFSPIPAPGSVDVLVVMEISEILRPGFLELLKTGGTIILNNFKALPVKTKLENYPGPEEIGKVIKGYNVFQTDANDISYKIGDKTGRSANVVILGIVSMIKPFNSIPEDIWLTALMEISPDDMTKSLNRIAFVSGRKEFVSKG